MNCHPDVELIKSHLESFLQFDKEAPILTNVFRVNEDTIKFITVFDPLVPPDALDNVQFPTDSGKFGLYFESGFRKEFARDGSPIIVPQGQEYFEATECAHGLRDPLL